MQEQEGAHNLVFLENDVAEATFPDDSSDIKEEADQQYEVNYWRKEEEVPTGYTFKSKKKIFVKAVDSIKIKLKKGVEFVIDDLKIKILDCRNGPNGAEIDIEIVDKKDRGQAVLKIFGPNSRKECTLMINKSKKHDAKFVKILAVHIIKRLVDNFISGQSWNDFFEKKGLQAFKKPKSCESCGKGFLNDMTLNRHIKQYHIENKICCDLCEDKFYTERSLDKHIKGHHTTSTSNFELREKEVVDKSKFKEHESVDHNQVSVACDVFETGPDMEINPKEHKEGDHMQQRFRCDLCENMFYNEIALNNHVSVNHAELLLEKEDQTEEMEIDEVIVNEKFTSGLAESNHIKHESMDVDLLIAEDEALKRSNLKDSKVLEKEKKREEDERKYESIQSMNKAISDEDTDTDTENVLINLEKTSWEEKRVEDELIDINNTIREEPTSHEAEEPMEIGSQQIIDEVNKSNEIEKNQTKLSKRKRKRKKLSTLESIRNTLPDGLKPIPENIKHFTSKDSLILSTKGDGACALNAASAHIFEDQGQGRKFRSILNNHMERKFPFYSQKISFPYERQVGVAGKTVRFDNSEEYLQYLRSNEAQLLWSDAEELIAIANLYQMDIRVITTKGPEDPEPTMATIGPDEDVEIKEFAMLKPGVVPTMTLLHTIDSHFDLVIPKDARIVKDMYGDNPYSKPESTELDTIKEEYENLKAVHTRCEKDIINLKDLVKELTSKIEAMNNKEKPLDEENYEFQNAKNLFTKKQMGFQRIGPQFEANKKPDIVNYRCTNCSKCFTTKNKLEVHKKTVHTNDEQNNCKNCAQSFKTKSELSKHMATHTNVQYDCNQCTNKYETKHELTNHTSTHTEKQLSCKNCGDVFKTKSEFSNHIETHTQDGDWNCDECSYQTNSHKDLERHKAYHGRPKDGNNLGSKNCNFCTQKFNTDNELEEHKQRHKTFKPCRNIPDCKFGINCLFNHNNYNKNKSLCYECGNEFNTFNELMFHRKNKHTMRACENFIQNRCRFSSERCWFNHNNSKTIIDKHQTKQHEKISCPQPSKKSLISEPSVFQNVPVNLAPPSTAPTEATWRKMITMMEHLNQMMQIIKKTNPFLSL